MKTNFDVSLTRLLAHEGGFTTDARDPGNKLKDGNPGSTNLGVTQAVWESFVGHAVSRDAMRGLTRADVGRLYEVRYWDACKCNVLPTGIDYLVFDFAVNAGAGRSVKTLQQALSVPEDGVIGPVTLHNISVMDKGELIARFSEAKEEFYKSLKTFDTFGKGWLNRVAEVKGIAQTMVG